MLVSHSPHYKQFFSQQHAVILVFVAIVLVLLSCENQNSKTLIFSDSEQTWIDKQERLIFSVDDTYPPLNFRNKEGELVGINVDLVALLGQKIGIPIELSGNNWDEALRLAMNHEVDGVVNATALESRKQRLSFTQDFMHDPRALVTRIDEPNIDLNNSEIRVAAKKNSIQGEFIRHTYPNAEVVDVITLKEGIALLNINDVDALYDDLSPLYHLISSLNLNNVKIESIEFQEQGAGIGLRNDDPILLAVVNKAVLSISDEERNAIKEQWLSLSVDPDYTNIYMVLAIMVVAVLVIGLWSKSLQKLVDKRTAELGVQLKEREKSERQLVEYKDQLESTVRKRTSDLESLNQELVSTNDELRTQKDDLNKMLKDLRETQKQLIQSEKMASVGMLSAGVAHEINNPLNFIQGGVGALSAMIKNNKFSKERANPFIMAIEEGVRRAAAIIKSLNEFSRQKAEWVGCDLHKIIDNCLLILNNQIKNKIELVKEYSEEPKQINGNEGKLHQVFLNIIANAGQAIDKKGKIIIETAYGKNGVVVKIKDSGSGIKDKDKRKIGNPFFTTKEQGKGTGLGLYVTFKIVHEHNGEIEFESKEGIGTEVTVTLPYN